MLSPTFSENGTFVQPVGKYLDMSSWNLETSSYIKWAGNILILNNDVDTTRMIQVGGILKFACERSSGSVFSWRK